LDLWTSPAGNRAYLGVVAHWCDASGEIRAALIGLPEVIGKHSGQNIAKCLFDVVKEYGIGEKIGYFQLDNATNNDTVVAAMDSILRMNSEKKSIQLNWRNDNCAALGIFSTLLQGIYYSAKIQKH